MWTAVTRADMRAIEELLGHAAPYNTTVVVANDQLKDQVNVRLVGRNGVALARWAIRIMGKDAILEQARWMAKVFREVGRHCGR